MRYTHEDLPGGKLYADGVRVPKAIWFDTDTGEYEHYLENALGAVYLAADGKSVARARGFAREAFRLVPSDGGPPVLFRVGVAPEPMPPSLFSVDIPGTEHLVRSVRTIVGVPKEGLRYVIPPEVGPDHVVGGG